MEQGVGYGMAVVAVAAEEIGPSGEGEQPKRDLTEAQKRLDSRRLRALDVLLEGQSDVQAAKAAGVCRQSIARWQLESDLRQALLEGRESLLRQTTTRLHAQSGWAVDQLLALAQDPKNPPYTRVVAARALIDLTVKTAVADDHAARLGALEEELAAQREEDEG